MPSLRIPFSLIKASTKNITPGPVSQVGSVLCGWPRHEMLLPCESVVLWLPNI